MRPAPVPGSEWKGCDRWVMLQHNPPSRDRLPQEGGPWRNRARQDSTGSISGNGVGLGGEEEWGKKAVLSLQLINDLKHLFSWGYDTECDKFTPALSCLSLLTAAEGLDRAKFTRQSTELGLQKEEPLLSFHIAAVKCSLQAGVSFALGDGHTGRSVQHTNWPRCGPAPRAPLTAAPQALGPETRAGTWLGNPHSCHQGRSTKRKRQTQQHYAVGEGDAGAGCLPAAPRPPVPGCSQVCAMSD